MMITEFCEKTGLNVTVNEYEYVERIYNAVKMDKDDFCKWWVKNQKNALFHELVDAYLTEANHHREEVNRLTASNNELRAEYDDYMAGKSEGIQKLTESHNRELNDFAEKLLRTGYDELKIYDLIEEEFGIDFIIRAKHRNEIPLSDSEISYLVGKL